MTHAEAALQYARLGIPIVAEHTPDPNTPTGCDCRKEGCRKPGKHPRTLNGSKDATTDEATIRRWFDMWTHANLGTSLEMAGLVIIGPDSPEWHAEFKRRGLKDGPVAQSGGGEGHLHYYRRLPEGVPATRICKPGEYDILAKGNAILAPSLHASGRRYEWLTPITTLEDIPYLEEWACAELRTTGARQRTEVARDDTDGPPILLDDFAMQVWRGELPKLTPDGTVDRSGSLLKIGRVLYDAGATRRLLVDELAERDATLYQKYAGRSDAQVRYQGIVDELERTGRNSQHSNGPILVFDDGDAPAQAATVRGSDGAETCRGCSERDERIGNLLEQIAEYKAESTLIRRGPVPTAEALGLAHLVSVSAGARTRGEELVPLYVPADAKAAGVGDNTLTRALNQVRRWQDDDETSAVLPFRIEEEYRGGKKHLRLRNLPLADQDGPGSVKASMCLTVARLPRDPGRAKHGGERIACPKHPDAALNRTRIWSCTEDGCGWVHQDTARLGGDRHQDGPAQPIKMYGAAFFEEIRAAAPVPAQDGPYGDTSYPAQDGPAPGSRPVAFVSREDMEWADSPRLRLVEEAPQRHQDGPAAWRCQCGSLERYPRPGGGWRCDGCGEVTLPAVSGGAE